MGKIRILEENVSNAIAAGEVVENPTSMIKELLENSLDAKSSEIFISIKRGGLDLTIKDNGCGMSKDDLILSTERHSTSKIRTKEDLFAISSYGFRGEALSSIASVSKMKMISKTIEDNVATQINLLAGKITTIKEVDARTGTEIEIKDLFFNTPARLKFLRKESTEYTNIKDMVLREALANSNVKITLEIDGKESIKTSGNGLENTIYELFGRNTLKNLQKFAYGYVGNMETFRASKDFIYVFVNNRMVKSLIVENAIIDAYHTKLMKGKFPFAIVFVKCNPSEIDVNVHPSKKIVKFANQGEIYKNIKNSIEEIFENNMNFDNANIFLDNQEVKTEEINKNKEDIINQNLDETNIIYNNYNENKKIIIDNYETNEYNENVFYNKQESLQQDKTKFIESNNKKNIKQENIKLIDEDFLKNNLIKKNYNNNFNQIENFEKYNNFSDSTTENNFEKNYEYNLNKNNLFFNENDIFELKNKTNVYNFKVIGQLFDTFILVERDEAFEIYDQHIIHERILYEKLKMEYESKSLKKQQLLVPIRISVNFKEKDIIMNNLEIFSKFAFEIDSLDDYDKSKTEILLRAVPVFNFRDSYENSIRFIIDSIINEKDVDILENILISMSCKGAIKANHKLNYSEMYKMVAKLHEVGKYTCPHGRPIISKINKNDMEKLFKRK